MDIFFYIEMKKQNENLIKQLEETIISYNEIMSYINKKCEYNYITTDLINFYNDLCIECEQQMIILQNMKKVNNKNIYELCEHNFITDIIDINPEKEQTICYCTICEFTKE
jgi:esterase/lipase